MTSYGGRSSTFARAVARSRARADAIRAGRRGGASNEQITEALRAADNEERNRRILESEAAGGKVSASVLAAAKAQVTSEQRALSEAEAQKLLRELTQAEAERLRAKYQDDAAINEDRIRQKILMQAQINRAKRETYPEYIGPAPGEILGQVRQEIEGKERDRIKRIPIDQVPRDQLVKVRGDPNVYIKDDWLRNQPGAAVGGGGIIPKGAQKAYTRASARIDPITGERVIYGGGMAGDLIPGDFLEGGGVTAGSALDIGYANLFRRKARREEGTPTWPEFDVKTEPAQNIYHVGERHFDTIGKANQYVMDMQLEGWKAAGVFDPKEGPVNPLALGYGVMSAQRAPDDIKFGLNWDGPYMEQNFREEQRSILIDPFRINGVKVKPGRFSLGLGLDPGSYTQEYDIDTDRLDKFAADELKTWTSSVPLWRSIKNPLLIYGVESVKAAEVQRRAALLNAKDPAARAATNKAFMSELDFINNPLGVRVTSENRLISKSERVSQMDLIPFVDVTMSPAAATAVTATFVGSAVAAPAGLAAVKGGTSLGIGVAGVRGAAGIGANYAGGEYLQKAGYSPFVVTVGGLVSGTAVYGLSGVAKNKLFPMNQARVVANSFKQTGSYRIGRLGASTTGAKDIFSGKGKPAGLIDLRGGAYAGSSAGSKLPVFVTVSNALGESKLIPTFGGAARFKSVNTGVGSGLSDSLLKQQRGQVVRVSESGIIKAQGRDIGGRIPVAGQDIYGSIFVGSGKAQKGYHALYAGTVKQKNIFSVGDTASMDYFQFRGGGAVAEMGQPLKGFQRVDLYGLKSTRLSGDVATGSELVKFKMGGSSGVRVTPRYYERFITLTQGGGGSGSAASGVSGSSGAIVIKTPSDFTSSQISLMKIKGSPDLSGGLMSAARMKSALKYSNAQRSSGFNANLAIQIVGSNSQRSASSKRGRSSQILRSSLLLMQKPKAQKRIKVAQIPALKVMQKSRSTLSVKALQKQSVSQLQIQKQRSNQIRIRQRQQAQIIQQKQVVTSFNVQKMTVTPIINKPTVPGPWVPGGGGGGLMFGGGGGRRGGFRVWRQRSIKLPGLSGFAFLGGNKQGILKEKTKLKLRRKIKRKRKVKRKVIKRRPRRRRRGK